MIRLWQDEIRLIDAEVEAIQERDPHLSRLRYPDWLKAHRIED